ncbi:hypothetical protein [Intrasporangium chromatireducens]|uniref:hypothetical protein n=1 Tax=Intrasporangium chromatireducens TaxID=1386088 RepID=UPI0012DC6D77|nr:hypothetical protein [Intrasporangium chromatireducens]
MSLPDKRNPGAGIPGAPEDQLAGRSAASLAETADHALVVLAGIRNGGTRRRVYFNLPSAHLAVERAHRRGLPASLHLVRLLPVPMADLDSLGHDALGGGGR